MTDELAVARGLLGEPTDAGDCWLRYGDFTVIRQNTGRISWRNRTTGQTGFLATLLEGFRA